MSKKEVSVFQRGVISSLVILIVGCIAGMIYSQIGSVRRGALLIFMFAVFSCVPISLFFVLIVSYFKRKGVLIAYLLVAALVLYSGFSTDNILFVVYFTTSALVCLMYDNWDQ